MDLQTLSGAPRTSKFPEGWQCSLRGWKSCRCNHYGVHFSQNISVVFAHCSFSCLGGNVSKHQPELSFCFCFFVLFCLLIWKMWVYVMISVRPAGPPIVRMGQKLQSYDFLGYYRYGKCLTLYNDSPYWALLIHSTFSDLVCTSTSQQCQTFLTENFMFLSD